MRSLASIFGGAALLAILGSTTPATALPQVITDTYFGQNNSGSGGASQVNDVIGAYKDFDAESITFTQLGSGGVTAKIRFNYHSGDATLAPWTFSTANLQVGDLLFSSGGTYEYGVALVDHDGYHAGDLIGITGVKTSDDFLSGSGLYWRFDNPVRIAPGGTKIGDGSASTVNVGGYEVETALTFTPGGSFWGDLLTTGSFGVHFASATCANDVIDGTLSSPVPEPTSLLLLASGLAAGAGALRRRLRPRATAP